MNHLQLDYEEGRRAGKAGITDRQKAKKFLPNLCSSARVAAYWSGVRVGLTLANQWKGV